MLWAARERIQDLRQDRRFRYIIVFKNHGTAAGASLDHSHSQLIALPIVPREVRDEVDGAKAHFVAKERCVFCDILRQETRDGHRLIAENADMVAVAPLRAALSVRDVAAAAAARGASSSNAPRHEYASLARLLGDILRRINRALGSPPYNLLIHTAPIGESAIGLLSLARGDHPEADEVAGVRMGNRVLSQSDVAPREAAQVLRDART